MGWTGPFFSPPIFPFAPSWSISRPNPVFLASGALSLAAVAAVPSTMEDILIAAGDGDDDLESLESTSLLEPSLSFLAFPTLRFLTAVLVLGHSIFNASPLGGSPFWHNLHKIKNDFKLGAKFSLGNGRHILFWEDWWTGSAPLKERFPLLFAVCANPNLAVSNAYNGEGWYIRFRRTFGEAELAQWGQLWQEIEPIRPSEDPDTISWALEPSGVFSTRSLYRKLCTCPSSLIAKDIWKVRVPLKIKIFT